MTTDFVTERTINELYFVTGKTATYSYVTMIKLLVIPNDLIQLQTSEIIYSLWFYWSEKHMLACTLNVTMFTNKQQSN